MFEEQGISKSKRTFDERLKEYVAYRQEGPGGALRKSSLLRHWMYNTRKQKDTLSPELRERLDEAGFVWESGTERKQKGWMVRYHEAVAYKARYGHVNIPWQWAENKPLSDWVHTQRRDLVTGSMKDHRKRLLDDIVALNGFVGPRPINHPRIPMRLLVLRKGERCLKLLLARRKMKLTEMMTMVIRMLMADENEDIDDDDDTDSDSSHDGGGCDGGTGAGMAMASGERAVVCNNSASLPMVVATAAAAANMAVRFQQQQQTRPNLAAFSTAAAAASSPDTAEVSFQLASLQRHRQQEQTLLPKQLRLNPNFDTIANEDSRHGGEAKRQPAHNNDSDSDDGDTVDDHESEDIHDFGKWL
jgi:Helicase associated domain